MREVDSYKKEEKLENRWLDSQGRGFLWSQKGKCPRSGNERQNTLPHMLYQGPVGQGKQKHYSGLQGNTGLKGAPGSVGIEMKRNL